MTNIAYRKEQVETKLNSIKFRGPDNLGILKLEGITLAHLRLAIIDLEERSNQPMTREELTIVYNGEIYNFRDIRKELISLGYRFTTVGDTEVILNGYKQWGTAVLQKLNGMFSFAIYNNHTNKIFCARDRLGVKPFYYFWKDGYFEICSQLRPIINSANEICEEGVSIYLDCGYIPSPYTIIKDIYKLPPGNFMEIDLNTRSTKMEVYWDLQAVNSNNISYEDAKSQLHDLLKNAVSIRMQSDVPLGTFLSGGIDSALVSAIAASVSKNPIKTFTIGFEDSTYNESHIAKEYAQIIASRHSEVICTAEDVIGLIPELIKVYDEPFADSSALPSLLVNSLAKNEVTVALSGDGGDESFLGYNHFDSVSRFALIEKTPFPFRKALASLLHKINHEKYSNLSTILKMGERADFLEAIFIGYDSLQKVRKKDWLNNYREYESLSKEPLQQAADLNIKLWLENDSNVKVDRASMANSVEVRSPFLDYRVIEFARTLPVSYRYRTGVRKKILRDILKNYIPENVFNQPKRGFAVPIGKWIRKELKNDILDNLSHEFLCIVPNLNVSLFTTKLEKHLAGDEDNTFAIWKLYVLSRWYREFGFFRDTKTADNLQNEIIEK